MSRYRYEFDSREQFPDRRRDRRAKNMPLCWLNANRVIIKYAKRAERYRSLIHIYIIIIIIHDNNRGSIIAFFVKE